MKLKTNIIISAIIVTNAIAKAELRNDHQASGSSSQVLGCERRVLGGSYSEGAVAWQVDVSKVDLPTNGRVVVKAVRANETEDEEDLDFDFPSLSGRFFRGMGRLPFWGGNAGQPAATAAPATPTKGIPLSTNTPLMTVHTVNPLERCSWVFVVSAPGFRLDYEPPANCKRGDAKQSEVNFTASGLPNAAAGNPFGCVNMAASFSSPARKGTAAQRAATDFSALFPPVELGDASAGPSEGPDGLDIGVDDISLPAIEQEVETHVYDALRLWNRRDPAKTEATLPYMERLRHYRAIVRWVLYENEDEDEEGDAGEAARNAPEEQTTHSADESEAPTPASPRRRKQEKEKRRQQKRRRQEITKFRDLFARLPTIQTLREARRVSDRVAEFLDQYPVKKRLLLQKRLPFWGGNASQPAATSAPATPTKGIPLSTNTPLMTVHTVNPLERCSWVFVVSAPGFRLDYEPPANCRRGDAKQSEVNFSGSVLSSVASGSGRREDVSTTVAKWTE
ncbi:hypothetical protein P43SY_004425 [Pythium insidiosum]|uniref:Uncharacterized protein n=1 Tax=Pythium insidiosum TaxID=114742 RepID=A0AAD5LP66_PYTIN|nr:hypothetical protein P43SY_004425 [Pythium insidiosum]